MKDSALSWSGQILAQQSILSRINKANINNCIGVNPPVPTGSLPFSRPCLPFTPVSRFSPVSYTEPPDDFFKYDIIHF